MGKVTELRIGGPRGGADRGGSGEGAETPTPVASGLQGRVPDSLSDTIRPVPAVDFPHPDQPFVRLERGRDFEPDDLTLPWWFIGALTAGVWLAVLLAMTGMAAAAAAAVWIVRALTGAW